jgi:hypothetical protein
MVSQLVGVALCLFCRVAVVLCVPTPAAELATSAPAGGGGGLISVKSFGATGDGVHDDGRAIQAALCAASGRTLWFPAGTYSISAPLQLAGARRLLGEGRESVTLLAAKSMPAVLVLPGRAVGGNATDVCAGFPCPPSAPATVSRTNGVAIEGITFDGNMLADFSVFAGAIQRSTFVRSGFHNARVAGLYIGYGWINEVLQCSFTGSHRVQGLVGLWLDFAANSINVLDSMFEGRLGVGVIANEGSVVRIEGNTVENMGGPAIVANQISSLTIRSNYFEGNYQRFANWSFVTASGLKASVCSDVVINGDSYTSARATLPTQANSLSLSRFAAAAGASPMAEAVPPGQITLSNARPCNAVVLETNFHNPSGNPLQYCSEFAGAFVAGATGLRSESNECTDCQKYGHDYKGDNRTCTAVATGEAPTANATLADFRIDLNTGDFRNH